MIIKLIFPKDIISIYHKEAPKQVFHCLKLRILPGHLLPYLLFLQLLWLLRFMYTKETIKILMMRCTCST